jgi:hypothetical protein
MVTAALAGNAISGILPGGAAAAALTAFSMLEVGALLALPVVALPAVPAGTAVSL